MGRPVNDRYFGEGNGKLQVTRHFFTGGSELSTKCWILSQRSGNKFKVTDGSSTEVLTLVNKAAGTLVAGEMSIDGVLDDSTVVQVTKIYNRGVQYEGDTRGQMVIGGSDAGGEDDATANTVTVDGQ
ncbi:uncharacterized protein METZ01_LOCUS91013 [marine metagenome]|jgi:hypothetical protein|uniref:Uncharacterized protein n=1 Tax=marine metagenome TaxID=408172 RepID=A0A381VCR1_9ZZZZ|tara:strand:- start:3406 stop:3786 length:381 start_codon:yes stop_codon:yes gene_type:complete